MKKFLVVLALLILLVAVAGCKEDGAVNKTASTGATDSEDSSDVGSADADAEEASDSGLAEKFGDFIAKKGALKFTVTYEFKRTGGGTNEVETMTQYFDGTDKFRMDTTTDRGEGRVYFMDNAMYSCTQQAGKWQCMKLSSNQGAGMNPTEQFDTFEKQPDKYNIAADGTKMVAGTLAACFKVTTTGGTFRQCFSKEGVPLYMLAKVTTGDGFTQEMTAKSYKASVSAGDFTLPAKATDLSELMNQAGQGMPEGYDPSAYADE